MAPPELVAAQREREARLSELHSLAWCETVENLLMAQRALMRAARGGPLDAA
ncbi:hypothetical protein [Nonomuraea turcica]|uniref:hypothetical protein n=1 Tax=Nonomuraea sp. G32 TaxID=3067274 RepID=UPI00273C252F|nr:hypothetical protein [Nonomuraea sp. G32]MDP4511844.1 hypothetical protein [Nonomuraea sp. G32]